MVVVGVVIASPTIPQTIEDEHAGVAIETAKSVWVVVTASSSASVFTWVPAVVVAIKLNPVPAVPPVLASRNPATPMMKSFALPVLRVHEGSPDVAVPVHAVPTSGSKGCAVFAPETPKTTISMMALAVVATVAYPWKVLVSVAYQVSRSHVRPEEQ